MDHHREEMATIVLMGRSLLAATVSISSGQVHDEVILEGPEESAEEALAETVRCMQQPWDGVGLKELRVSRPAPYALDTAPRRRFCLCRGLLVGFGGLDFLLFQ